MEFSSVEERGEGDVKRERQTTVLSFIAVFYIQDMSEKKKKNPRLVCN